MSNLLEDMLTSEARFLGYVDIGREGEYRSRAVSYGTSSASIDPPKTSMVYAVRVNLISSE
jgi:hypothetical protein